MILFVPCVAGLLLLGGYLGFRYACARVPDPDWESQQELEHSCWSEFAVSIPLGAKWLRGHGAEDVYTRSFDGLKLAGKWVPARESKATIILFHGYHSSYLNDFAAIFSMYHSMGLNLLLVRQRAHGESEGKYITFGVRESRDVLSWIDFHNRTHGADNVFLGGMSMGASTVLFAAGEKLPPNVRGITADCGFTSPREIMAEVIRSRFHLPPKPVLPLVGIWTKALAGFGLDERDTRRTLARSKVPVILIHGTGDRFVPCSMSQAGFDACTGEKELILVEGAGHGRSYLYEPDRLTRTLVEFFNKHISTEYS